MHCTIARGHLSTCRVTSDTSGFSKATPIARRLTKAIHVVPERKAEQKPGAQAIVSIMYSPGECGWQCIPTRAPNPGSGK